MKIAYIVHGYTNSGGTERVLATKTNYLVEKGFEIFIISMGDGVETPFFSFSPKIKFYHLNLKGSDKNNKALFIERVSDYFKEIVPDISITVGFGLSKYLYEIKDRSKKIYEYHFSKYRRKFELASLDKYLLGRFITDIYSYKHTNIAKKYDRFVVLTEEDKELWRDIPNICVINNPLSFVTYTYSDNSAKRVIAVGRYTYQKGYEYLIDIWAEISKKYPDWKLSLFGAGSKKKYLEKRIEKRGLSEKIELNPPSQDIEKEYAASSIYAMTSRYEGFGLVLTEAMSCGLPVVSFACKCGPKDIINNKKDGFLIDFKDKKTFIDKLSLLIENEELRRKMGVEARKNAHRFRVEEIMPRWETLFKEIMSE